eukprot:SAG31_NODE_2488_length_5620_cov_2.020830_6_plen_92_part_00
MGVSCMAYLQLGRITAAEVLEHPWITANVKGSAGDGYEIAKAAVSPNFRPPVPKLLGKEVWNGVCGLLARRRIRAGFQVQIHLEEVTTEGC